MSARDADLLPFARTRAGRVAAAFALAGAAVGAPLGAGTALLEPYAGDVEATLEALTPAGTPYDLAEHRGEVVLVNFWASWCAPCVKEMPSMERLAARLADEPFSLVAVNMGEDADAVTRFVDDLGVELDVLLDPDGTATRHWGVFAYPSSFLVGPGGEITHVRYGAAEWDDAGILSVIESLLP